MIFFFVASEVANYINSYLVSLACLLFCVIKVQSFFNHILFWEFKSLDCRFLWLLFCNSILVNESGPECPIYLSLYYCNNFRNSLFFLFFLVVVSSSCPCSFMFFMFFMFSHRYRKKKHFMKIQPSNFSIFCHTK